MLNPHCLLCLVETFVVGELQGADQDPDGQAEASRGEGGVCWEVCPETAERGENALNDNIFFCLSLDHQLWQFMFLMKIVVMMMKLLLPRSPPANMQKEVKQMTIATYIDINIRKHWTLVHKSLISIYRNMLKKGKYIICPKVGLAL